MEWSQSKGPFFPGLVGQIPCTVQFLRSVKINKRNSKAIFTKIPKIEEFPFFTKFTKFHKIPKLSKFADFPWFLKFAFFPIVKIREIQGIQNPTIFPNFSKFALFVKLFNKIQNLSIFPNSPNSLIALIAENWTYLVDSKYFYHFGLPIPNIRKWAKLEQKPKSQNLFYDQFLLRCYWGIVMSWLWQQKSRLILNSLCLTTLRSNE